MARRYNCVKGERDCVDCGARGRGIIERSTATIFNVDGQVIPTPELPGGVKVKTPWYEVSVWEDSRGDKHVRIATPIAEPGEPFGKNGFEIIPGCGARWVVWSADWVPLTTGYRKLFAKEWIDVTREP